MAVGSVAVGHGGFSSTGSITRCLVLELLAVSWNKVLVLGGGMVGVSPLWLGRLRQWLGLGMCCLSFHLLHRRYRFGF